MPLGRREGVAKFGFYGYKRERIRFAFGKKYIMALK
jgi:hypothetical protein